MSRTTLKQQWQDFQQDRVLKISAWYAEHYEHAYVDDPLIKYIVLWSVFNALYNVYDLPNNRLPEKCMGVTSLRCGLVTRFRQLSWLVTLTD